jgi:hypothetical protein
MIGLGMIPPATPMNYISWGLVKYSSTHKFNSVSCSIITSNGDGRDGGRNIIMFSCDPCKSSYVSLLD